MINLAGFDFGLELSRNRIQREIYNRPPAAGPNGSIDAHVPPFVMMRDVPLPGVTGQPRIVVRELYVKAVPPMVACLAVYRTAADAVAEPVRKQWIGTDYFQIH